MKKTLFCSILTLTISLSILGCGRATAPESATEDTTEIVSATESSTTDSSSEESTKKVSYESVRCMVTEVSDDIVTLDDIKTDNIYQTPLSNLIGQKTINPEEEYLISFFTENKKEIGPNTYYVEKCELISRTVIDNTTLN